MDPRTEGQIGEDAVNALIAQSLDLTDIEDTSALSQMAKGVFAPELAEIYTALLQAQDASAVATAQGDDLDRRLADFGLARRTARAATGTVTIRRLTEADGAPAGTDAGPVIVPAGTIVSAVASNGDRIDFTVRANVTLAIGALQADAIVDATTLGTRGNIGPGAITLLTSGPIAGVKSITNTLAFTDGRDVDVDTTARLGFYAWLRGREIGTPQALLNAAYAHTEVVDGVTQYPVMSATLIETAPPDLDDAEQEGEEPEPELPPPVQIYVLGQGGALLTAEQTDGLAAALETVRVAGVPIQLLDPILVPVDIRVEVALAASAGPPDIERLRTAIKALVGRLGVGEGLKVKAVFDEVCRLGSAIENATVVLPESDVVGLPGVKLVVADDGPVVQGQ